MFSRILVREGGWPLLRPNSLIKELWDAYILLLTVYAAVEVPLRLVLDYEATGLLPYVDTLLSTSFTVDILLTFQTAVYAQGQLITRRRDIAGRYLRSWFVFDFLAAFPFQLILQNTVGALTDTARIVRLLRLFRLARIVQLMQEISRASMVNVSVLRMIFLAFWVLLLSHWMACGWMILGTEAMPPEDTADPYRYYLRSFYWAITTITTIGYGDITPSTNLQTIYTVVLQIVGAGMYGYVIGNIASLLANVNIARAQYMEKMEKINTFMKLRKIPEEIQANIRSYYEYLWESRRGYDEADVIHELPPSLQLKVALFLNQDIIEKVPIFKGANEDLIRRLVLELSPAVYTPGDFIFRHGEHGTTMFFISRGSVEILGEDGRTVYATLTEGSFFGEIALLLDRPRTASVRALDYCDLYVLDYDTFHEILTDYPEFAHEVRELARQRQDSWGPQALEEILVRAEPPGRVHDVHTRVDDNGMRVDWSVTDGAAIYQVERRRTDDMHWEMLHACVETTSLLDSDADTGNFRYRVRAVNQAGEGSWSKVV